MAGMSLRSGAKLSGMGEPPEKEGVPAGNEVEGSPGERSDPERVTARNDAEDKGRREERRGGGMTPRGSGRFAMRAERTQGELSPSEEQATVAGRGIAAPVARSEGGRGGQMTPSGSGNSRRSLERERRGVGWGGALLAGEEAEEEDQERDRASRSRTRKPRSAAHSPGEEPVCYKCREPGHFKRDCPKLQTCSYCQRKGHQADNCYTKQREQKGRGGRRGRIEELEEELRRLRAEEEDTMAEEEKPVHVARYAEESDEEGPEPIFMAANPGREREDLGLRSGAADGRRGTATVRRGPRATVDEAVEEAAGAAEEAVQRAVARMGPRRHPFERMAARPCVVEALEGTVAVEGKYPGTTIIDTGASQVLVGRRLAKRLGLHRAENVTPEGVRIQTAEGGDGTWLPRTIRPQEVVLAPGRAEETRIRVHCLVSDSEDYDLLLGMELLYKVGAVVDTWAERVTYQPLYWDSEATRAGEEGAVLPARFLRGRVEYREPHHQRVPEQRWEDAGVYLERAASRRRMEEAAGARVEELREARGLAEPAYDFETFNRPVRLVELFGGVGPGLAACVRLGMVVERWTYVEKNPESRGVANGGRS
ncbi:unnamed protein product [Closterium sp. NIES-64]|nr:unnamed protein product [Closterium sp. NIES-64]